MKAFMDKDFLLNSETASKLFYEYANECPIIDYHNHLSPKDIYNRRKCENLTQLWLETDHYKWRAMRVCGVDEKYITGSASEWEKFLAFATILPRLIGTPVYHWAHLELRRYFGIETVLTQETAKEIWDKTSTMLKGDGFNTVSLLNRMNVKVLCTTDDPVDSLEWHLKLAADNIEFKTLPSFRPDRFIHIDAHTTWEKAIKELGLRYGEITDWESLKLALIKALDFFVEVGCRVTDHSLSIFRYACGNPEIVVAKALKGEVLSDEEVAIYEGALLRFLAEEYAQRDLIMQLHLGPIRNNSPKLMEYYGVDAGGDSIGSLTSPELLSAFLSDMEADNNLPKTILYNLNPADSAMLATMAVNFASNGAKVQYGAAWWLLDHIRGINAQLDQLMETGLLSGSVGMLTDSRAFTSFVRHEYYRRILCNKIADLVEDGQYPYDLDTLGKMIENICWKNAVQYFGFTCK